MATWILVANASRARLFSIDKKGAPWTLQQQFDHPESRAKNSDLAANDRGRMEQSAGRGNRPAMEDPTEPKQVETERFARELRDAVESGVKKHVVESLVITAPPAFLGMLRKLLSPQAQQRLSRSIDKDYTQAPDRELPDLISLNKQ